MIGCCGTVAALTIGCLNCNSIACVGGFELNVSMSDGDALPEGEYLVHLVVETSEFDVHCQVTNSVETSNCEEITSPDGWNIGLYTIPYSVDGPGPPTGFRLGAVDESDSHGRFDAMRGPDHVGVTFDLNGGILGEGEFDPEYEHRDDFYGDERCGYCDKLVSETLSLARPFEPNPGA
jgi:hypothetical protein